MTETEEADREEELRLYYVVRSDIAPSAADLIILSARATLAVLETARGEAAAAHAAYDGPDSQIPKIALRVKKAGHFGRAEQEARDAGIPVARAHGGDEVLLCLGPVRKSDLPNFIAKLQMYAAPFGDAEGLAHSGSGAAGPVLEILVRRDLDIPSGKLVAQAGHAAQWGIGDAGDRHAWLAAGGRAVLTPMDDDRALRARVAAARAAGRPAITVTDAGRTVFGGPTLTLGAVFHS